MVEDREKEEVSGRRDFLKLAGAGTVLGGAALAAGGTAQAAELAEEKGGGYRETSHVKEYYDLARF